MDRRLGPGSKPFRNQCQGTGVQPQVYKSKKTFKGKRGGGGVELGGNKLQSFISIITIKNTIRAGTGFSFTKESRKRKTNVVNRAQ